MTYDFVCKVFLNVLILFNLNFINPFQIIFFQVVQIEIALLSQKPSGVRKLKELAASEGGLINDDLRRRVWPKLLNIDMVIFLVIEVALIIVINDLVKLLNIDMVTFLVFDDIIIVNHLFTYYKRMEAHCKCSSD